MTGLAIFMGVITLFIGGGLLYLWRLSTNELNIDWDEAVNFNEYRDEK